MGLIGGLIFLLAFSYKGGIAFWTAGLYFLVYYLLAMGLTRIRAEVGPPTHEMFVANPRYFLTDVVGTRRLPQGSLTMIALYRTFNRGHRAHPMSHTAGGYVQGGRRLEHSPPSCGWSDALDDGGRIFAAFWAYLTLAYKVGGHNVNISLGSGTYSNLRNWLYFPTETNFPARASSGGCEPNFPSGPFIQPVTPLLAVPGPSDGYGFPYLSVGVSKRLY